MPTVDAAAVEVVLVASSLGGRGDWNRNQLPKRNPIPNPNPNPNREL
jgi:hypothetical protein